MGINNLTILTHTHTDCKDLWGPYFDAYETFFNTANHLVMVNEISSEISLKQLKYDSSLLFSDRLIFALGNIETDFVLISLEDMILYGNILFNEIEQIIYKMIEEPSILYTRLIKSGVKSNNLVSGNLFRVESTDFLLSITPAIWSVKKLKTILSELRGLTIWDLELIGDDLLRKKGINGLYYYYNGEPKRGGHYDSSIFPHICTAIGKGKWNTGEYSKELTPIFEKYGINPEIRGTF